MEIIRACIRRGEAIAPFYLSFLKPAIAEDLLRLARASSNTKFPTQLHFFLHPRNTSPAREIKVGSVARQIIPSHKSAIHRPAATPSPTQASQSVAKTPDLRRPIASAKFPVHPTPQPQRAAHRADRPFPGGGKSKKKKKKKSLRSFGPYSGPKIIKAWEPPKVTLGRDTSVAAQKATVFETDTTRQFIYVGGNASSPVQSDKAANLPSEH